MILTSSQMLLMLLVPVTHFDLNQGSTNWWQIHHLDLFLFFILLCILLIHLLNALSDILQGKNPNMLTSDLSDHCAIICDSHLTRFLWFLAEHYLNSHKSRGRITCSKILAGMYYAVFKDLTDKLQKSWPKCKISFHSPRMWLCQ